MVSALDIVPATSMPKRDQAERLLSLLEMLSRGRQFSVNDTASEYGVRRETIYRDIRRLRGLGYPLETDGDPDYLMYCFAEDWARQIRVVSLTCPQIEATLLAIRQYCRIKEPHRLVQLVILKLRLLHSQAGPPARVRVWQSITESALSGAQEPDGAADRVQGVAAKLAEAVAARRWCELAYVGMAERTPRPMRFAPHRVFPTRVLGRPYELTQLEMLNLERIQSVVVTDTPFDYESSTEDQIEPDTTGSGADLERADEQVLRLIGMVRMLDAGQGATLTELAAAFSTTLTTIRRDRALLEYNGYATSDFPEGARILITRGECGFGKAPELPLGKAERSALLHMLERFRIHHPVSSTLASVIQCLSSAPADELIALTSPRTDAAPTDPDEPFWTLVEVMLNRGSCVVEYNAHWRTRRLIEFAPRLFEVDTVMRVNGTAVRTGEQIILQVPGIVAVRQTQDGGNPNTR